MTQVKRTLWVDQLSRSVVAWILLNPGLRRAGRLMYRQSAPAAQGWLRALQRRGWLRHHVDQFEIRMGDKRVLDGRSLFMAYEDCFVHIHRQVCDDLWRKHDLAAHWYRQESVPRVRLYLEYQLANEIQDAVQLVSHVLWQMEQEQVAGHEPSEHVLILPRARWGRELKPHLEKLGLCVHLVPNREGVPFRGRWPIVRRSLGVLRLAARQVGKHFVARIQGQPQNCGSQTTGPYRVSVLYTRSTDLDERNDLFWLEDSGLRPQDILVCFELDAIPVLSNELARLRQQGYDYVVRSRAATLSDTEMVWQHTARLEALRARSAGHSVRLLPMALVSRAGRWQWWRLVRLMSGVDRWQDFYESERVRVDIRKNRGVNMLRQAIALDNLGGVSVDVQWSAWLRTHPLWSRGSQVFFCWGPGYVGFTDGRSACLEVLIQSGYLFDRYFAPAKVHAQEIRRSLAEAGAEFVVALFDERLDERIWPSNMLTHYYTSFLKECLQDPTFGLVIKSKSNDTFTQLAGLQPLLQAAQATGRCCILEDLWPERRATRKNNPVFPVVAALASDLAVSLLSSTGIEAALAGVPSVYYDTLRGSENLTYERYCCDKKPHFPLLHLIDKLVCEFDGAGRVVFQDLDELLGVIREHRRTPGGLPRLGDFGPILNELDPFRDGRAGERIGTYIRWFLDKLSAGHSRDEALAWANAQYAARSGADKVVVTRKPEKGHA